LLENAFTKEEMNFVEVEIAFMLVKEKLFEEKMRSYHHYFNAEGDSLPAPTKQRPPDDFYR